jgi:uncharacterized protein YeaO (DUF488 family)
MLKKGSISDLRSGAVSRETSYIVVAMQHYPRGVSKKLIDEYIHSLAPSRELLDDFHAAKERLQGNHNAAFQTVKYEQRFSLSTEAIAHLRRLAEMSATKDVTILCQCASDQRCHRELLLLVAKKWYGAKTELRKFSYPEFERRIPDSERPIEGDNARS